MPRYVFDAASRCLPCLLRLILRRAMRRRAPPAPIAPAACCAMLLRRYAARDAALSVASVRERVLLRYAREA